MLTCFIVGKAPARPLDPTIPVGSNGSYKADRRVLRSVLLDSQDPYMTYNSAFTSYTLSSDSVTAHFADGSSTVGSLLVGADGIRSKVASQLFGESAQIHDLGVRVIYGKTLLTPKVEDTIHATLKKGVTFVTDNRSDGERVTVVLEAMRFTHVDAPQNYLFWALGARSRVFAEDDQKVLVLPAEETAAIASRVTAHWDPSIRIIFDEQDVGQTAILRLTSSNPDGLPIWPTEGRVTVLGDAVHCMPPTGGQGANSAMYDAALLGEALGRSRENGVDGWRVETIRGYEAAMRYNIGDIVGLAWIAAEKVFGARPLPGLGAVEASSKVAKKMT